MKAIILSKEQFDALMSKSMTHSPQNQFKNLPKQEVF